ncbi:acyl carrier protein [Aeoliella sp. ICT_H6.2]|uniref:Acyl carrier protein n=1 Tax=Aeoliella straminimaris TaxID=2954799 RepID=A0A9X2F926_9BACT|nr:acyl carrier protein [Aeoliella straminimaris]MCO6044627.1 acyl carrier protein [Aeoliella straminimaris]
MGLDGVELIIDIEEYFGISIQDGEAEQVRTVGDLVTLIQRRIDAAHATACPTLSSFLLVRTCVRQIVSNDRLRVRTDSRVVDVLTAPERVRLWRRLADLHGIRLPALRRSTVVQQLLWGGGATLFLLALVLAGWIDLALLPLTITVAVLLVFAAHLSTLALRRHPPEALDTFGELASHISGMTVASKQLHLQTFDSILNEVRPIIVQNLGVEENEVVAEASFVNDLGMS